MFGLDDEAAVEGALYVSSQVSLGLRYEVFHLPELICRNVAICCDDQGVEIVSRTRLHC